MGLVLRRLSEQGTYIGSVLLGLGEGVMVSKTRWLLGGSVAERRQEDIRAESPSHS